MTSPIKYKINGRDVTDEEFASHNKEQSQELFGEMLQSRQPPRCMTDDVYLGGVGTLDQQITEPDHLDKIVKTAIAHGYRPKPTDFYRADIAEFPGDPRAFFNHGSGRGEIKKRLEEKGMHMDRDGDVHCREPEEDPYLKPKFKLHPKLVERHRKRMIQENPDLAQKDQREVTEEIVAEHGWNEER